MCPVASILTPIVITVFVSSSCRGFIKLVAIELQMSLTGIVTYANVGALTGTCMIASHKESESEVDSFLLPRDQINIIVVQC